LKRFKNAKIIEAASNGVDRDEKKLAGPDQIDPDPTESTCRYGRTQASLPSEAWERQLQAIPIIIITPKAPKRTASAEALRREMPTSQTDPVVALIKTISELLAV